MMPDWCWLILGFVLGLWVQYERYGRGFDD